MVVVVLRLTILLFASYRCVLLCGTEMAKSSSRALSKWEVVVVEYDLGVVFIEDTKFKQ